MKTNWLWDTRLTEEEVKRILKDPEHPKFNFYAAKLFARISNPAIAFNLIEETVFCQKWPMIKKIIKKDRWAKDRIIFWQTIYERVLHKLQEQGIKIRHTTNSIIPPERIGLAQQIKNIRQKIGYTQKDIAQRMGVIQQYISKIESGRENVSIDTLKRIADVFGKDLIIKLR